MLLLNATALVVVALARGASASVQAAHGTAAAWSLAAQGIEAAVASPCRAGDASGVDVLLGSRWPGASAHRDAGASVRRTRSSPGRPSAAHTSREWRGAPRCPAHDTRVTRIEPDRTAGRPPARGTAGGGGGAAPDWRASRSHPHRRRAGRDTGAAARRQCAGVRTPRPAPRATSLRGATRRWSSRPRSASPSPAPSASIGTSLAVIPADPEADADVRGEGADALAATWNQPPQAGDRALVWVAGATPTDSLRVVEIDRARAAADAACAASPLMANRGAGAERVAFTGPVPGVPSVGAPLRITRRTRYSLYRAGDGDWYLDGARAAPPAGMSFNRSPDRCCRRASAACGSPCATAAARPSPIRADGPPRASALRSRAAQAGRATPTRVTTDSMHASRSRCAATGEGTRERASPSARHGPAAGPQRHAPDAHVLRVAAAGRMARGARRSRLVGLAACLLPCRRGNRAGAGGVGAGLRRHDTHRRAGPRGAHSDRRLAHPPLRRAHGPAHRRRARRRPAVMVHHARALRGARRRARRRDARSTRRRARRAARSAGHSRAGRRHVPRPGHGGVGIRRRP